MSEQTSVNTDRELWREVPDDYYAPSIHVTKTGGVGINVGGLVIVMPLRAWHDLARNRHTPAPQPEAHRWEEMAKEVYLEGWRKTNRGYSPTVEKALIPVIAQAFAQVAAESREAALTEAIARIDQAFERNDVAQDVLDDLEALKSPSKEPA